eukprot:COSAG01_NODE_752_length_13837_cov_76.381670_15_plen_109_part_00
MILSSPVSPALPRRCAGRMIAVIAVPVTRCTHAVCATHAVHSHGARCARTLCRCDPPDRYRGTLSCVRAVAREEGPWALYAGLGASMLGIFPYAAIDLGYAGSSTPHN